MTKQQKKAIRTRVYYIGNGVWGTEARSPSSGLWRSQGTYYDRAKAKQACEAAQERGWA